MSNDYNNNLKYKLPANNDSSEVVLNSNFSEWTNHITKNVIYPDKDANKRYEEGSDKELLVLCKNHAMKYQQPKGGENTIMLTHPLYLHLTHMNKIQNERVRKEVDDYLDNLLGLLNLYHDSPKVNVVLLETIHHYAAATSLLVENGFIDRVIFTLYQRGELLDTDEFTEFEGDNIFWAGGYNDLCLTTSIQDMTDKTSSEKIWAIDELVLNSPLMYDISLRTSEVLGLSSSKMIKLEGVIRRLSYGY